MKNKQLQPQHGDQSEEYGAVLVEAYKPKRDLSFGELPYTNTAPTFKTVRKLAKA